MASRYIEALAFLTDPNRVTWYSNAKRAATACLACGVGGADPCRIPWDPARTRDAWHAERQALAVPRGPETRDQIIEKLARRYARTYDPMESYGPRRYPR